MSPVKVNRKPFSQKEDEIILSSPSNLFAAEKIKKETGIKRNPGSISVRRKILSRKGKIRTVKVTRFGADTVKKMVDAQLILGRMSQDPIQKERLNKFFNNAGIEITKDENSFEEKILNDLKNRMNNLLSTKVSLEFEIEKVNNFIAKTEIAIAAFSNEKFGDLLEKNLSQNTNTEIVENHEEEIIYADYPREKTWRVKVNYILKNSTTPLTLSEIVKIAKPYESRSKKILTKSISATVSTLLKNGLLRKNDNKRERGWSYELPIGAPKEIVTFKSAVTEQLS